MPRARILRRGAWDVLATAPERRLSDQGAGPDLLDDELCNVVLVASVDDPQVRLRAALVDRAPDGPVGPAKRHRPELTPVRPHNLERVHRPRPYLSWGRTAKRAYTGNGPCGLLPRRRERGTLSGRALTRLGGASVGQRTYPTSRGGRGVGTASGRSRRQVDQEESPRTRNPHRHRWRSERRRPDRNKSHPLSSCLPDPRRALRRG